ncbi:MAG: DODA-type extradiol aromatic ring-opening family dioxygenase, partial [Sphaerochaetaceae bacterium]
YYGFPKEAYEIQYPVPGNPTLAKRIHKALQKAEIVSRIDEERGFDHGLFIPLKLMYPDADIPMVQISLVKGLSPKEHLAIGKTLQELAKENILIIGSGFSFHNMRAFDWEGRNKPDERNNAFQDWLIQLFTGNSSSDEIENNLIDWENAPYARYCHPREEHFIPALVCFGASQNSGSIIFDDYILGKRAIAVQW